jgi:hypothetical protein
VQRHEQLHRQCVLWQHLVLTFPDFDTIHFAMEIAILQRDMSIESM